MALAGALGVGGGAHEGAGEGEDDEGGDGQDEEREELRVGVVVVLGRHVEGVSERNGGWVVERVSRPREDRVDASSKSAPVACGDF